MAILRFFIVENFMQLKKITKGQKLFHMASKQKSKATLYYETLKVGENKVPLFFHLEA